MHVNWLGVIVLGILAIVVVGLIVMALTRGR
jgi:hypothetical protein